MLKIEHRKIKEITPYENNPRNNDNTVRFLVASIQEFGFKNPIIVDKDNVIIAGHTRLKAAKKLKMREVPVIVADDLTEEEVKGLRLADNKTGELAEWNLEALATELKDLTAFDMTAFGFEIDDLPADDIGEIVEAAENKESETVTFALRLHENQLDMIDYAFGLIDEVDCETYGNTNVKGNKIYKVVTEWAEQKTSN